MAIPDVDKLEPMPKKQEYQLHGPDPQVLEKRTEVILESREGGIFQITEINDNPPPPSFINFEFFISDKKKEMDLPPGLFVPLPPSSTLNDQIDQNNLKKSRSHDLPLDKVSISIRVSKIRGSINYDCVVVPGNELPFY